MKENRSETRSQTEETWTGCWDKELGQKFWELESQNKQQRQVKDQQCPTQMETRGSWNLRKTETHYMRKAGQGETTLRQRQVPSFETRTGLTGQEQGGRAS